MLLVSATMRTNVARAVPTIRRHERAADRRPSTIAARRRSSARAGLQIGGAAIGFLVIYVTLQLLHALGRDPAAVAALTPIPMFARLLASAAAAVPVGLALGLGVRDRARSLRRLPAILAAATALFILTVLFFA